MFRIETEPRYWWPVVVGRPDHDKPGAIVESMFEAQFKWLDDEAYGAWLEKMKDLPSVAASALEICTGFRNVQQEDGAPLPNTAGNLALLLKDVGSDVVSAYFASRKKAAEKNS